MSEVTADLQAILGRSKTAKNVAARDFQKPRRLGHTRVRGLRVALENLLPALERTLIESTGMPIGLSLDGLGEVDADRVFTDAVEPLCVLRFQCSGSPAWLVWDPAAAVEVLETLFGGRGTSATARKLSPTEVRIASGLLEEITRQVTAALGLDAQELALVQVPSELGTWREAGSGAESHRFEIRLLFKNGDLSSLLRFYLPGVEDDGQGAEEECPEELPAHLERVEIELSAHLSGCDISLDQLLALEEGDVIPLEARLGDPATLSVEGLILASARLGSHRGRLAVRIEQIDVQTPSAA